MTYSPFEKPLRELNASDLGVLFKNNVAEGYWIEYKSEFQSSEKIAKSISSLANSYGGWYFIGIEADKTKNIPTKICGFSLVDIPDPIAKLRESIKSNTDPIPVFHPHLIEISEGKCVLVVEVPNNQETPFITKNGRIYRRISDSSDPVPENNRQAIDRLVDNGKELVQQFEDFCKDERTFSQAEEKQCWINIFISPYPLGTVIKEDMVSEKGLEDLLKLSHARMKIKLDADNEFGSGNLPFTSGQVGIDSVILRQVQPANVAFNSLTAELFLDGRAKFYIPVRYLPILDDIENKIRNLKSLQVQNVLKEIMMSDNDDLLLHLDFFDINQLLLITMNLLTFYEACYGDEAQEANLRMVITLEKVWRLVPFCDLDAWGSHVQKFGLPVRNVRFIKIPFLKKKGLPVNYPLWKTACLLIAEGFGLPFELYAKILFSNQTVDDAIP